MNSTFPLNFECIVLQMPIILCRSFIRDIGFQHAMWPSFRSKQIFDQPFTTFPDIPLTYHQGNSTEASSCDRQVTPFSPVQPLASPNVRGAAKLRRRRPNCGWYLHLYGIPSRVLQVPLWPRRALWHAPSVLRLPSHCMRQALQRHPPHQTLHPARVPSHRCSLMRRQLHRNGRALTPRTV
jgi:hypothetical protein